MLLIVLLFVLCLSQELSDDLKVQLAQQQAAASDATQALASREEELQKIKASSTTEVQAWQVKADELKEVRAAPCAGSEAVAQHTHMLGDGGSMTAFAAAVVLANCMGGPY